MTFDIPFLTIFIRVALSKMGVGNVFFFLGSFGSKWKCYVVSKKEVLHFRVCLDFGG